MIKLLKKGYGIIKNLDYHEDRWTDGNWSKQDLIDFEDDIIKHWEGGEIRA